MNNQCWDFARYLIDVPALVAQKSEIHYFSDAETQIRREPGLSDAGITFWMLRCERSDFSCTDK